MKRILKSREKTTQAVNFRPEEVDFPHDRWGGFFVAGMSDRDMVFCFSDEIA